MSAEDLQQAFTEEIEESTRAGNLVLGQHAQLWSTLSDNLAADKDGDWHFFDSAILNELHAYVGPFSFPDGPDSTMEGYGELFRRFAWAVHYMRGVWEAKTGKPSYF